MPAHRMHQGRPVVGLSGLDYPEEGMDAVPTYVTKDSGQRAEYASGMVRDSQELKPRFDLLLARGIPYDEQFATRVAELAYRGSVKYGDRNHEKACTQEEVDRMKASAYRHLMQWMCGETDEDHAAAVAMNLFMAESTKWRREHE